MRTFSQPITQFDAVEMQKLVAAQEWPAISIFLPMHEQDGSQWQTGPLRLQQLFNQVQMQLLEVGLRRALIDKLLEPTLPLLEANRIFWQIPSAELALFLSPTTSHAYRLPPWTPEKVVVGANFYVRPLLPLLLEDGRYYILTLSQNNIRLLEGSQYGVHEVPLLNTPASLAEAMQYDQVEPVRQLHSIASSGRIHGAPAVAVHGQGTAADEKLVKEKIGRYLQQVGRGVAAVLTQRPGPIVLAGVDYLSAIYQQLHPTQQLLEEHLAGNPDHLSAQELYERSWPVVAPLFQRSPDKAHQRYLTLVGQDDARAVTGIEPVLQAVYARRIDTLLVAATDDYWGCIDAAQGAITPHTQRQVGDEELLNWAVIHTLQQGGAVYPLQPLILSHAAPIAALLHF
jgi:hypothetical protein